MTFHLWVADVPRLFGGIQRSSSEASALDAANKSRHVGGEIVLQPDRQELIILEKAVGALEEGGVQRRMRVFSGWVDKFKPYWFFHNSRGLGTGVGRVKADRPLSP